MCPKSERQSYTNVELASLAFDPRCPLQHQPDSIKTARSCLQLHFFTFLYSGVEKI